MTSNMTNNNIPTHTPNISPEALALLGGGKIAYVKAIKSVAPFLNEFAKAWGPDGTLKTKGMVVAPEDVRTKNADIVSKMTLMDASGLK